MEMPLFRLRRPLALLLSLPLALTGCASSGGSVPAASEAAGQVNAEPPGVLDRVMQTVGLVKAPPPAPVDQALALRIFTAKNLNAGTGRKPLALVVKVYRLRSLDRFRQTPFDTFLDKDKTQAALGDDLVDGREMLLLPDQHYVSTEQLPNEVKYLGFVALFRSPAAQRWRFAYDVPRSATGGITLGVHACAMSSTQGALVTELPDDAGSLASVHCPRPGG